MVKNRLNITAKIIVFLQLLAICIEQATGTTIIDDTIKAPTALADIDTVTAVNIVKIKLILFTGTPESFANLSLKVI